MFSCKNYNRLIDLSPYYYHVALHHVDKDDFFDEQLPHETIKSFTDLFVHEYKKVHRNCEECKNNAYDKHICSDYELRYRNEFRYTHTVIYW